MPKFIDLTERVFGAITVLSFAGKKGNRTAWKCVCECGNFTTIIGTSLVCGKTISCGCRGAAIRVTARLKHGKSQDRIYRVWVGMRQRCNNPNNKKFADYGGRGISVCGRWDDFESFILDMGPRPDGFMIERMDNDGNYSPSNCVWADLKTQVNNRRSNRRISLGGQTKTMTQWADILGVNCSAIKERIERGWPLELALTAPSGTRLKTLRA